MSEIEAFPRAVLKHHYPDTPLHGDFTTIQADEYGPIDVLVGGTPCQSFSIAGLRGGLADERGNLALEYIRLVDRLRPRWVVWENVPGVLSSASGRDFGAFLGGLGECGYGWSYRVLDAQYFGLAQRRKRVFVVGCLGDWRGSAQVLAIPEGLRGHPAPSRTQGEGIAPTIEAGANRTGGTRPPGTSVDTADCLIAFNNTGQGWWNDSDTASPIRDMSAGSGSMEATVVARSLNAHPGRRYDGESETFVTQQQLYSIMPQNSGKDYKARPVNIAQPVMAAGPGMGDQGGDVIVTHSLRADGFDASEDGTGRGTPLVADLAPALTKQGHLDGQSGREDMFVGTSSQVRRLTPTECERLQGFPDNYTAIPWRNGSASDGPRYRALGNSMAVPCIQWIGRRIMEAA
jgi:DNA (cytosine-5)-methyltransferase 1